MENRVIFDRAELEGTGYFEFLPRKFEDKHWNPDSVYISQELVFFFSWLLRQHVPRYSHFSCAEATGEQARQLAEGLIAYSGEVEQTATFEALQQRYTMPDWAIFERERDWSEAKGELARMVRDLGDWILRSVPSDGVLTVRGV